MTVMIANGNKDIISEFKKDIKFNRRGKYLSTFWVNAKTFERLYQWVKDRGFNPYALMSW